MTAMKGSLVLLKAGDGATPTEAFTTLGGLQVTRMVVQNRPVASDTLESGAWRSLAGGAGLKQALIEGHGIFTNAASEDIVRANALAGSVNNYKLAFPNGSIVSGAFIVAAYAREGDVEQAEAYAITLESAGAISYSAP
jgi:TP901-1 family phage major tail protein